MSKTIDFMNEEELREYIQILKNENGIRSNIIDLMRKNMEMQTQINNNNLYITLETNKLQSMEMGEASFMDKMVERHLKEIDLTRKGIVKNEE